VTSRVAAAQHLRDLALLRRVRDRIDREYAQRLDVEALARGAHLSAGHSAASSASPTASRPTAT
jgi:AraC-like DNA-binding protein